MNVSQCQKWGYDMDVVMNGERTQQVDCFRYLGVDVHEGSRVNEEIGHSIREGNWVGRALRAVHKTMSVEAMKGMSKAGVVPSDYM